MEDTKNIKHKRKPPKTNMERSKQHRIRKKKFIEEMEQECKILRERVRSLEKENHQLKEQLANLSSTGGLSSANKFEHSLHQYEDYVYNNLGKKILDDPAQVKYSTLEHAVEHIQEWSDDRIDYIKTLFNKILDNMVSHGAKCFFL
ncbi:unnamed protein product [Moneuplotes crassus]|uniref:BZIP domain-containing protein n=1 Tax=Euplotes crassus TaxID=5936 RepID=A0AAD2D0S4_EUPCR|nr:unnamed protein product [Moneuplotes crassus]